MAKKNAKGVTTKITEVSKKIGQDLKKTSKDAEKFIEKPIKKSLDEGDSFLKENINVVSRGIEKLSRKDSKLKRDKAMKKKSTSTKTSRLVKTIKKDLDILSCNTSNLLKKMRLHLTKETKKGEKELEIMALVLKREKLYYQLGKETGSFPKRKGYVDRKLSILNKIKMINRKITLLKRK